MLGRVGRAVVLLVRDEGGQAAEPDVAQAAEPVVAIGHGCLDALVRVGWGRGRARPGAAVRGWGLTAIRGPCLGAVPGGSGRRGPGLAHAQPVRQAEVLDQVPTHQAVWGAVGAHDGGVVGGGAQARSGGARVLLVRQVGVEAVEAHAAGRALVVVGQRGQARRG